MEKKDRIAHYQWRKKVNEEIPALASRVFALRGKIYNGCGFHYYLEHRLGLIMADINSTIGRLTFELVIKDQVSYEAFVTDLEQVSCCTQFPESRLFVFNSFPGFDCILTALKSRTIAHKARRSSC
jgi:hypothetical protein